MTFPNVYDDAQRAASYADLELPGTYFLAYRDLPAIIGEHVRGRRALDFGCGAGRSTRFLQRLGFATVGVDISAEMLAQARRRDPGGEYVRAEGSLVGALGGRHFDLVLAAFTFDNVPAAAKPRLFADLVALLPEEGRIVSLVSSPDIYLHEWASFTTRAFPENRRARAGERVRIVMTDVTDGRPVEDVLCTDESYREVYDAAGLEVVATHRPLGRLEEPYPWVTETHVAPWVVYVLAPARTAREGSISSARAER